MAEVKKFRIDGVDYDIAAVSADSATHASMSDSAASVTGLWINEKNNLELSSPLAGAEKLNLVSADAVQVKPGQDGAAGKVCALQLDSELGTETCDEFPVKVCNGTLPKKARVIDMKLNANGLTIDTQNAKDHTTLKDDSFDIKVRYDKWNGGLISGESGPTYLKVKARAMDFRCFDHGGIALQVAGQDSDNHENKIKFESDRTSEIGQPAAYCKEGGKGLEFGTFNNLHTSLYTGDYRFKGDAMVYGATRVLSSTPNENGKIDYVTQGDDFKDKIEADKGATWNQIIKVAKDYAEGKIGSGSSTSESGTTTGVDLSNYVTKGELETVSINVSANTSKITNVSGDVDFLKGRVYRKLKNGNLEIDASGLMQYGTEKDPTTEGQPDSAGTPANSASLDLVSDGKVAVKAGKVLEIGAQGLTFPIEIDKNDTYSCGGYEASGITSKDILMENLPYISLSIEKNKSTVQAIADLGTVEYKVSVYDLIHLKSRVDSLEATVKELQAKIEELSPKATE